MNFAAERCKPPLDPPASRQSLQKRTAQKGWWKEPGAGAEALVQPAKQNKNQMMEPERQLRVAFARWSGFCSLCRVSGDGASMSGVCRPDLGPGIKTQTRPAKSGRGSTKCGPDRPTMGAGLLNRRRERPKLGPGRGGDKVSWHHVLSRILKGGVQWETSAVRGRAARETAGLNSGLKARRALAAEMPQHG